VTAARHNRGETKIGLRWRHTSVTTFGGRGAASSRPGYATERAGGRHAVASRCQLPDATASMSLSVMPPCWHFHQPRHREYQPHSSVRRATPVGKTQTWRHRAALSGDYPPPCARDVCPGRAAHLHLVGSQSLPSPPLPTQSGSSRPPAVQVRYGDFVKACGSTWSSCV